MVASLENLGASYCGKRVVITGHTGFKGAWLSVALLDLGASVTGIGQPALKGSLFEKTGLAADVDSRLVDIRDERAIGGILDEVSPEYIFHLAAQSLVPESFREPVETFDVNVVGTASLLSACREIDSIRSVMVTTSDKVYANHNLGRPFTEGDPLGGRDPYSASKAATELLVRSWRASFMEGDGGSGFALGVARAGNVIGGGDRSPDRIIPDIVRSLESNKPVLVRNPDSVRPWQFVLEPVVGYLMYGAALASRKIVAPELNFGPSSTGVCTVSRLVQKVLTKWGSGTWRSHDRSFGPEAHLLQLDSSLAFKEIGWRAILSLDEAVDWTMDWYRHTGTRRDHQKLSVNQFRRYMERAYSIEGSDIVND